MGLLFASRYNRYANTADIGTCCQAKWTIHCQYAAVHDILAFVRTIDSGNSAISDVEEETVCSLLEAKQSGRT